MRERHPRRDRQRRRAFGATLALAAVVGSAWTSLARTDRAEAVELFEHRHRPEAGPFGPITVIGDSVLKGSLTQSWGVTLDDHLLAHGWGPIQVRASVGMSAGGSNTESAPYWINQWRAEGWDPAAVMVNLGANDSAGCNGNVECNYARIMRTVAALGPGKRIWWPKVTQHPVNEHVAAAWNVALDRVAAERPDFYTWDWPAVMAGGGFTPASDFIHLSPAGYRRRSQVMAAEITADLARGSRTGGPAALPAAAGAPSEFLPLTTTRLLDTRGGASVAGGEHVEIDVSGDVPPGTTAVAVYVSATQTEDAGYVTAYPCGTERPLASAANYAAGATRGAVAIVPVADGRLCLFTKATAHLLADLQGAFVRDSDDAVRLTPLGTPQRLADTRETGRRSVLTVAVPGDADAVALNLTAVGNALPGHLTAYPCGAERPLAAAVNHNAGEIVAGSAFVPVSPQGTVCVYTKADDADIVVDLTATLAHDGGLVFTPVTPTRTIDTRNGTGGWSPVHGQRQTIDARVAPPGAQAVSGTLTIAGPARPGFLRAWGCDVEPSTSNVNAPAAAAFANLVTTGLGADGTLCVSARSLTNTIFDTTGWWTVG